MANDIPDLSAVHETLVTPVKTDRRFADGPGFPYGKMTMRRKKSLLRRAILAALDFAAKTPFSVQPVFIRLGFKSRM
jgi:hypothetical protein